MKLSGIFWDIYGGFSPLKFTYQTKLFSRTLRLVHRTIHLNTALVTIPMITNSSREWNYRCPAHIGSEGVMM